MVDSSDGEDMAKEGMSAARGVAGDFAESEATRGSAAPIIDAMFPGMTSPQIADALGNRVSDAQVRLWKTGRRPVPQWVRETANVQIERLRRALEQTKTGPGKAAGWRNIGAWRAAQNSER